VSFVHGLETTHLVPLQNPLCEVRFTSETSCRPVATLVEAVRIAQNNVGVIMTFRTIAGYQCHAYAWNLTIAALGSRVCYAGRIVAVVGGWEERLC